MGINCWYQDKIYSHNKFDVLKVKICVSFSFQYSMLLFYFQIKSDGHEKKPWRRRKQDFHNHFFWFHLLSKWFWLHVSTIFYNTVWQKIADKRKREEIWLSPITKSLIPTKMSNVQSDNTKTPPQCSIRDRIRKVRWYSHLAGVVNRFTGPTFPLLARALQSKGHTFKNFVNKPTYIDKKVEQTNSHTKRRGNKNRYTKSKDNKYYI